MLEFKKIVSKLKKKSSLKKNWGLYITILKNSTNDLRTSWKFKEDWLKTVGRDRFLIRWSTFLFLVCGFHDKHFVLTGFDPLYLENCFEFNLAVISIW